MRSSSSAEDNSKESGGSGQSSVAKSYAFFDLDHTLLPFDTQVFFANFVLRKRPLRRVYLLWFALALPLTLVRILDLRKMKRLFFSFLWKMRREELDALLEEFLDQEYMPVLYPDIVAELKEHQNTGLTTILNSASPEFYVKKIAARLGFDHYIGTNLIVEECMPFLPKITGPNNKREAKIAAMWERDWLPSGFDLQHPNPIAGSWAYSDSSADIPLLQIAEHGVMIHPSASLQEKGREHGWDSRSPSRPYRGKWGAKLATVRQVLGLWPLRH